MFPLQGLSFTEMGHYLLNKACNMAVIEKRKQMLYSLPKSRRIKGKQKVEDLFSMGKGGVFYPLKVYWKSNEYGEDQVLFAVAKKRFNRAVDRNLIKRKLRESFRLNQQRLCSDAVKTFDIGFVFIGEQNCPFKVIEKSMKHALDVIADKKID